MSRFAYYEQMRALAQQVRLEHHLRSPRVLKSDLRRLYRVYGIKIDLWPHKFKALRGAYFDDDLGPTVLLARQLPPEPMIFTMAHELKHHLVDRGLSLSYCDPSNAREPIEIGAEIFAAELIFPQRDFVEYLRQMGIGPRQCTPEVIVRLKHETQTTLSYAGLAKRAEFLNFAAAGSLAKVPWKKLEAQLYGEPVYKRLLRSRQDVQAGF
ncbi:MAG TPA: ImmA/IrrE family metallo-endopeptidase [Anaerolineae bacterium]|nr:ImmA/IrrE family metallo-endopeptidase [Anaerolineae bacterium]